VALFPVRPVMLIAGDDPSKKPVVMSLVAKLGFEPVDAGPLRIARLLEPYGNLRPVSNPALKPLPIWRGTRTSNPIPSSGESNDSGKCAAMLMSVTAVPQSA